VSRLPRVQSALFSASCAVALAPAALAVGPDVDATRGEPSSPDGAATPGGEPARDAAVSSAPLVPPKPVPSSLGSQQDDRGPIGDGFGERWIATPTVSSNPKLSTAFGAIAIVFLRLDDSIASTLSVGANYSVSNSWTAFAFGRFNFAHDRERVMGGLFRGHAANSYDDFMSEGIALESTSNVFAAPAMYFHRLGPRSETDWWLGGQLMYVRLEQSGEDATSSEVISELGLESSDAIAVGPNLLLDSRDNTNAPTRGQRLFVRANLWALLSPEDDDPWFGSLNASYSHYLSFDSVVVAVHGGARFSFGAPLIFQSSLSRFRAYTVGEQIAENTVSLQTEVRIPFGNTRLGAAAFAGVATLFDDFADWGDLGTYYPMGGAGLRFVMSEQQRSIVRLEYAQGIGGARGIYLAMGQAFQ